MKTEVIYFSRSGNTRKVAEVIAKVFETEAKELKTEISVPDFDLLCVGSGCYFGKPGKEMTAFLESLVNISGKKAVVFGTYSGQTSAIEKMKTMLEEKGIEVVGTWGCKGRFLLSNRSHPDKEDLENASQFAQEIRKRLTTENTEKE